MQVYPFWARARVNLDGTETDDPCAVTGLGWSNVSERDARTVALARARKAAARIREQGEMREYPYPDRPIREQIVDRMQVGDQTVAAVTRNGYGAFVLNAASAMFIDIDQPLPESGGLLRALFSRKDKNQPTHEQVVSQRIEQLVRDQPGAGVRLYRTAAGLRAAVIHRPFDPAAAETLNLMQQFGGDPQYVQLCRTQKCFRARLTPKPWRCGVKHPPKGFPFENDRVRQAYAQWSQRYEQVAAGYAACELVGTFGSKEAHPQIDAVLRWHDELACREGAKLA